MNTHLWTYKDESFIPHGVEEDGFCEQQAVYLTCTDENPNKAKVRFLVDRADSEQTDFQNYDRVVIMFSDDDKEAVNQARKCWKRLDNSDIELGYWQQNSNGGWEKKK